mgnify:CR=1 FL=1
MQATSSLYKKETDGLGDGHTEHRRAKSLQKVETKDTTTNVQRTKKKTETMPSSLNISCSCKACAAFLRPTVTSSSQPYLLPLFILPTAATTSDFARREKKQLHTPFWVDKLSLSAYDVAANTPEKNTDSQKSLSINTSSLKRASAVEENQNTRSAFPKTPGTLRCTHADCRTRIPVALRLAGVGSRGAKSPLCEEHGDVFYDAEEVISEAASETRLEMIRTETGFQASESLIFNAEGGVRGVGRASRKIPLELARRASSTVSWSSTASLDGSESSRSGEVSFGWKARAFDSKLCW